MLANWNGKIDKYIFHDKKSKKSNKWKWINTFVEKESNKCGLHSKEKSPLAVRR